MKHQKNPILEAIFLIAKFGGVLVIGIPLLIAVSHNNNVPWGIIGNAFGIVVTLFLLAGVTKNLKKALIGSFVIGLAPLVPALVLNTGSAPWIFAAQLTALLVVTVLATHFGVKFARKAWLENELSFGAA